MLGVIQQRQRILAQTPTEASRTMCCVVHILRLNPYSTEPFVLLLSGTLQNLQHLILEQISVSEKRTTQRMDATLKGLGMWGPRTQTLQQSGQRAMEAPVVSLFTPDPSLAQAWERAATATWSAASQSNGMVGLDNRISSAYFAFLVSTEYPTEVVPYLSYVYI